MPGASRYGSDDARPPALSSTLILDILLSIDRLRPELMGHANVYTTLNVYTQVMPDSLRASANRVGEELFKIVQFPEGVSELTH